MAMTNGALVICEMNNATREQIERAHSILVRMLRMREKRSVDWAYGRINLALAERQVARFGSEPDLGYLYKNILRGLDQAKKVFNKHGENVPKSVHHSNVLDTLEDWITSEIVRSRDKLYSAAASVDNREYESLGLDVVSYMQAIKSNPKSVGFKDIPGWFPSDEEVLVDALGRVPEFSARLKSVESYLRDSSSVHPELQLKLFSIKMIVSLQVGTPDVPFDALDSKWQDGEYELYLIHALKVVTWNASAGLGGRHYSKLLCRILTSLENLKTNWTERDVERLLERNPLSFRVVACELARMGFYPEAFLMLESSRGLVSSRTCNSPSVGLEVEDSTTWVHVTHSPNGTYVVALKDAVVVGKNFPDLPGRVLVSAFFNFKSGGVLSDQESSRARASAAANELATLLGPVADWIADNSGERVVLIPGGLYQAFPVWAVGRLGDNLCDGTKIFSCAPSRTISYLNRKTPRGSELSATAVLLEASNVGGCAPLAWSECEPRVFAASFPNSWIVESLSATAELIKESLGARDVVHFSGHSSADVDPYESGLITYGNRFTVRDILSVRIASSLVILGSCQSGLAKNMMRQDEYLSIQTALFYAGARFSIGTCWPIRDYVGFSFTAKFYDNLRHSSALVSSEEIRADDVLSSVAAAINWMRSATVQDVNSICSKHGAPLLSMPESEPAFSFYDWAAFGVTASGD